MTRFNLVAVSVLAVSLASVAMPAGAQDVDTQVLLDRMSRLERDVNLLQRQVYRGNGGSVAPGGGAGAAAAEVHDPQVAEQMRDITGRMEELRHGIDQIGARLDKLSDDVDMRLRALEQAQTANAAPTNPPPALNPPPEQHNLVLKPPSGRNPVNAGGPRVPPPRESPTPPDQNVAMTAPVPESSSLPSGTPQQQYDFAFGLLRDANYGGAETALRDFVAKYPGNALSGNAQYWLGETYYVRNKFDLAATAFAEGYQKYPKGPKAPDSLLKLGMSLGKLGRKADACQAFSRLDRDFPVSTVTIKEREAEERRHNGC